MITVDLDVFSYSPIDSPYTENVQASLCKQLKKVGDASSYIESKLSAEAYVQRILHKEHYHVLEHVALELNFDITTTLFSKYREQILRSFRYLFNNVPPSAIQTKIVDAPSGGQSYRLVVTINLKQLRDVILIPLQGDSPLESCLQWILHNKLHEILPLFVEKAPYRCEAAGGEARGCTDELIELMLASFDSVVIHPAANWFTLVYFIDVEHVGLLTRISALSSMTGSTRFRFKKGKMPFLNIPALYEFDQNETEFWKVRMGCDEESYHNDIKRGYSSEVSRSYLPGSLATVVILSGTSFAFHELQESFRYPFTSLMVDKLSRKTKQVLHSAIKHRNEYTELFHKIEGMVIRAQDKTEIADLTNYQIGVDTSDTKSQHVEQVVELDNPDPEGEAKCS